MVTYAQVAEALENARDNEYAELLKEPSDVIADDMLAYWSEAEESTPEELIPHINEWKKQNGYT
jgi:hypothetical protein